MSIPVKSGKAAGKPLPAGMHQVVVVEVRDLGDRPDPYNPGKTKREALVVYKSAAGEEAADFYKPTVHDKANLGKVVRAVNGGSVPKEFKDMTAPWPAGLMGMQCQILTTLKTNAKGYPTADITAVLPPVTGQNVIPAAVG